jgi:DNA polymerase alpha subunit A
LKQVLPAVDRICIPLEGTDRNKLAECLQINNQESSNVDEMDEVEVEEIEEDDNISEPEPLVTKNQHRNCESLKFKCVACNHTITYTESNGESSLTCVCGKPLDPASAYSQTLITTRRFIKMYYDSPYQCSEPSCGFQTKDQLPNDNESCLQYGCTGRLVRQVS